MERLLRATARAEARHFWFRGFRAFVTPLLEQAAGGRRGLRLVDCGCGTGANVALLGRFGRAFGFDLSSAGLSIARESGRSGLVRASVTAAPLSSASVDIATSFDVLYALDPADEQQALAEMFRIVKPGGAVVINVAAMDALRGDHSVLSHERRRYSRALLRQRVEAAGFRIERLTYTNFTLVPALLVARMLQRRRGLRPETEADREISVPAPPVNAALTALLYLEAAWLRRFDAPAGSSLLCLARKP